MYCYDNFKILKFIINSINKYISITNFIFIFYKKIDFAINISISIIQFIFYFIIYLYIIRFFFFFSLDYWFLLLTMISPFKNRLQELSQLSHYRQNSTYYLYQLYIKIFLFFSIVNYIYYWRIMLVKQKLNSINIYLKYFKNKFNSIKLLRDIIINLEYNIW